VIISLLDYPHEYAVRQHSLKRKDFFSTFSQIPYPHSSSKKKKIEVHSSFMERLAVVQGLFMKSLAVMLGVCVTKLTTLLPHVLNVSSS